MSKILSIFRTNVVVKNRMTRLIVRGYSNFWTHDTYTKGGYVIGNSNLITLNLLSQVAQNP